MKTDDVFEQLAAAAIEALDYKARSLRQSTRRQIAREVYERQEANLVRRMSAMLEPLFEKQIKVTSNRLLDAAPPEKAARGTDPLADLAFDPKDPKWRNELIDRTLPVMALEMLRAMTAEMMETGIDPRRIAKQLKGYNPDQPRDEMGRFGSGGGGGSESRARLSKKAARALKSHNPATKAKQDASEKLEQRMAKNLGAKKSSDNKPMDVTTKNGMVGIEVKMVHDGKADRVHMRKDSRQRKEEWIEGRKGRKAYTVVVDNRDKFEGGKHKQRYSGNKIYWKEGVGAFSFSTMQTARSMADLKRQLGL